MNNWEKEMGQRLYELRTRKGMSRKDFCLATGYSELTIRDWETGKYPPGMMAFALISKYFGTTLDWLMLGKGPSAESASDWVWIDLDKSLGERIKCSLESEGMSKAQLAKKADLTLSLVNELISDIKGPTPRSAIRIADALDVSLEYLINGRFMINESAAI